MARKKTTPVTPLPPRGGLGASRVRVPEGAPVRALDFVEHLVATQRHRHPDDDAAAVLARFTSGEVVYRDASPVDPDALVPPGTDIFFYRRPAPEREVPYSVDVVFEDGDLLVVDKPAFLATMPRASHITETATVRLRRQTGNEELTPAHRLDRATSGLLLFTKRREIRGAYQELFARREVEKRYEAIAPLRPVAAPATWEHHLHKVAGEVAATHHPECVPNSRTHLIAVEQVLGDELAALQRTHATAEPLARYILEPVTGRTHQLRVQMMVEAAPILGDRIYPEVLPADGEDFSVPMELRCVRLAFRDPLSGIPKEFVLARK